jgi:hypothetical protein
MHLKLRCAPLIRRLRTQQQRARGLWHPRHRIRRSSLSSAGQCHRAATRPRRARSGLPGTATAPLLQKAGARTRPLTSSGAAELVRPISSSAASCCGREIGKRVPRCRRPPEALGKARTTRARRLCHSRPLHHRSCRCRRRQSRSCARPRRYLLCFRGTPQRPATRPAARPALRPAARLVADCVKTHRYSDWYRTVAERPVAALHAWGRPLAARMP